MNQSKGETMKPTETEERRKKVTTSVMLRIAELKTKALRLPDTPEQYIEKCKEKDGH